MSEVEKVGLVMGLVSYLTEGLACISVHAYMFTDVLKEAKETGFVDDLFFRQNRSNEVQVPLMLKKKGGTTPPGILIKIPQCTHKRVSSSSIRCVSASCQVVGHVSKRPLKLK